MAKKKKNKYGQYFTIESIADFMVALINANSNANILEPSCGKGVFIKMLYKHGYNNVCAYEIDTTLDNPFNCVKYQSFVSSPVSEKFDVIIGNPPYIRWKNLEDELKNELAKSLLWNRYFNSLCDYLFIFILKSIEQLNNNGELIFICPEYWMNTTHSQSLRNYISSMGYISDIYQFKEAPLFEGVTSSFVIFRFVKSDERPQLLLYSYNKKGKPSLEELLNKTCFDTEIIPQFEIGERWILTSQEKRNHISQLEMICAKPNTSLFDKESMHRIGDYCDIGNGMVSGLDKAFQLKSTDDLTDIERQHIIKIYKAKDLQQYFNVSENAYIFIEENLTEDFLQQNCPHFYSQLSPLKEDLDKRYSYGKDLPYWMFAFPRNENLFKRKEGHIFIPCKERISVKNYFRFSFANKDVFPLQDVTGIFKKTETKESIFYILAYLNSERVFEWIKYNGIIKGEIVEFSEAPIASIPYRPINWDNAEDVSIHNSIVDATKNYISTKDNMYKQIIDNNIKVLFHEQN